MKKLKVAVLYGGFSSEREISLKTGKSVYDALVSLKKYDVELIDLKKENFLEEIIKLKNKKIDIVFIALHGKFGEDGKLQSILETLDIKYTGSSFLPSCLAMDKHYSKCIFLSNNINTPEWIKIKKKDIVNFDNFSQIKFPVIIKPSNEGSTIGVTVAKNFSEFKKGLYLASKYSDDILIEKYIFGREFTVPILGNEVLPIIEIKPKLNLYYDFKSKYKRGGSIHIIPPKIDKNLYQLIKETGYKAAKSLGCDVVCRVDIVLERKTNIVYVLEVNTIPGMTEVSLLPEAARFKGINFPQLVEKILFLSLEKYEKKF